MAYRVVEPLRPFFDDQGRILSGGELRFYEAGTLTAKSVYGDSGLTVNNGSTVALDSAGRPNVDVWGSGSYRVRVYDSAGVLIEEADPVTDPAGSSAVAIPALQTDRFLTNDGASLLWQAIRQVPDPTGSSGKFLGNDGANLLWQTVTIPKAADPDIVVGASSLRAGVSTNTSKFLIQVGTGSAPASGNKSTQTTVTFGTAYTTLLGVIVQPTGTGPTSGGVYVRTSVISQSATGFTAGFSTLTGGTSADSYSNSNIINPVTFTWVAFGLVTVA